MPLKYPIQESRTRMPVIPALLITAFIIHIASPLTAFAELQLATESPLEKYSPQTLFEIINGDADIYLKAGFVELEFQRYILDTDAGQNLEFSAYRMRSHRSAFAVFSVRRGDDAVPKQFSTFAYSSRDGLFFVHGPYYVQIIASGDAPELIKASQELAAEFIASRKVEVESIPELDRFPAADLVPQSIALHPAGAFGFKPFSDTFTARYRMGEGEATAFFRQCESTEEAATLADAYIAFLEDFDGETGVMRKMLPTGKLIRLEDTFTVVFTAGKTVAGVQDAASQGGAEKLAGRLHEALRKSPPAN